MGFFLTKKNKQKPEDIVAKDEDKLALALRRLEHVQQGVSETECLIREYVREFRGQIRKG